MSQDQQQPQEPPAPEAGKISIGEALASIRGNRQVNLPKKAPASKPSQRVGRPTAAFWVRNLQESVQKRADMLYDSIREDPGSKASMGRRDFYSSESFRLPLDTITAVVEYTPGEPIPPPRPLATFSDLQGVDVANVSPQSVPRSARVQSHAVANGEMANRTDQLQKLDLSGHLQPGETARPDPGEEMRFLPSAAFETGKWIIEEIRQAPKVRGRNLNVNPLIRKMFEKREG
jgi:hypothetical protein